MANKMREERPEMDMTPMIDCVFQLIIFFFLVIDLQNQDLEPVKLPKADFAIPDEPKPGRAADRQRAARRQCRLQAQDLLRRKEARRQPR